MSVYLDAIKVLEERGWTQSGRLEDADGAVCLYGAVNIAATGDARCWAAVDEGLAGALLDAIGGRGPSAWNDDPLTSYEDVVLALKRAHELAEDAA